MNETTLVSTGAIIVMLMLCAPVLLEAMIKIKALIPQDAEMRFEAEGESAQISEERHAAGRELKKIFVRVNVYLTLIGAGICFIIYCVFDS